MRRILLAACLALAMPAFAEDAAKPATPQQEKMKQCNVDASAKSLKGDERKAFMKECLSAKAQAKPATQQEKMKQCNADARTKNLSGDARKQFMSDCLKAR
jgi:hypothetical protein